MEIARAGRQHRLNGLFGSNNHLCLHVFLILTHFKSEDDFDLREKELGLNLKKDEEFKASEIKFGRVNVYAESLSRKFGWKSFEIKEAQSLFTLLNYEIHDRDIARGDASQDMRTISRFYIPGIHKSYPQFCFEEDEAASESDDRRLYLEFKYVVQQYDPSFCHPNDIGKLKPIEILGTKTIHPLSAKINALRDLSAMRISLR